MCRLQLAPGLGAINVTGPAISLKCLAYVCYLMLIFILFPLELLMLAVVSIVVSISTHTHRDTWHDDASINLAGS